MLQQLIDIFPILLGVGGVGWLAKDKVIQYFKKPKVEGPVDVMTDLEVLLEIRSRYNKGEKVYTDLTSVINGILNPPEMKDGK